MLALPDDQRQAYSWCCAGKGWSHGPLAMATVDPAVVHFDMHCVPPDRWHGVVDFIDNMTGAVREGLKKRGTAEVGRAASICATLPAAVIYLSYTGHIPVVIRTVVAYTWHMPGISHSCL